MSTEVVLIHVVEDDNGILPEVSPAENCSFSLDMAAVEVAEAVCGRATTDGD